MLEEAVTEQYEVLFQYMPAGTEQKITKKLQAG
jgi:hypothetical protein